MNKNQATTLFKVSQFQFPLLAFSIGAHKPQEGGIIFFLMLADVLGKQDG